MKEVQFSLVQWLSRVRLCDPTDCSTPGLPVHHQLLGLQTHVHWSIICYMCSLLGILRLAVFNLVIKLFILPCISQIQIIINEEHKIPQLDFRFPKYIQFISNHTLKNQIISFWIFSGYYLQFHITINENYKKMNKNLRIFWTLLDLEITSDLPNRVISLKNIEGKSIINLIRRQDLEWVKGDETDL